MAGQRLKKLKLVVTFPSITAAMSMEEACKRAELDGRLIPTPGELSAGCGLSWTCAPEMEVEIKSLLHRESIPFERICVLAFLV